MCENYPARLVETLNAAGKTTEFYKSSDGSGILVLPYGGRVLGLYSPQNRNNFLWTNPALNNMQSAKGLFQGGNWHNSGGHRTWIAPEISFFYPDYPDWSNYCQPRQLDHSSYQITRSDAGGVQLVNQFSIRSFTTKRDIELKITKSLSPALNPLRYVNETCHSFDCEYAGYELTMKLEIVGEVESADRVGLWDLVQMPHGGEVFIRTYQRAIPRQYFGEIVAGNLHVDEHLVTYKMRNEGILKFGIGVTAATGRMGYLYQAGDVWNLMIRNFFVNPSGEYIDVPCNDMHSCGDAVQVCGVNNDMGAFSELEYHVPSIGKQTRRSQCEDISQVWAFRGNPDKIRELGKILLSANVR